MEKKLDCEPLKCNDKGRMDKIYNKYGRRKGIVERLCAVFSTDVIPQISYYSGWHQTNLILWLQNND